MFMYKLIKPSRYFTATRNSFGGKFSPKAAMRAADNHALDWDRQRDRKGAFYPVECCFLNNVS